MKKPPVIPLRPGVAARQSSALVPPNVSPLTFNPFKPSSIGLADSLFDPPSSSSSKVPTQDSPADSQRLTSHSSSRSVPSLSSVGSSFTDLLPDLYTLDELVRHRKSVNKQIAKARRKEKRKEREKKRRRDRDDEEQRPPKKRKTKGKGKRSKKKKHRKRKEKNHRSTVDSSDDSSESDELSPCFSEGDEKAIATIMVKAEANRLEGKTVRKVDFRSNPEVHKKYSVLTPRLTKSVMKSRGYAASFKMEGGKPHIVWDETRPLIKKPKPKKKGKSGSSKPQPPPTDKDAARPAASEVAPAAGVTTEQQDQDPAVPAAVSAPPSNTVNTESVT